MIKKTDQNIQSTKFFFRFQSYNERGEKGTSSKQNPEIRPYFRFPLKSGYRQVFILVFCLVGHTSCTKNLI